MKQAITQHPTEETPLETAVRIRQKYGVSLSDAARKPLPKQAFDAMWSDNLEQDDKQPYPS